MKIFQKLVLTFFTLLLCHAALATTLSNFTPTDTITPPLKSQDYRIELKSIKIIKKRGKSVKIEYNISNSGKFKVKLGKGKNIPKDLIVLFDESLDANGLSNSKQSIIENLLNQKLSLQPGQLIMGNKLKFENISIPPTDRISENIPTEKESSPENNGVVQEEVDSQKRYLPFEENTKMNVNGTDKSKTTVTEYIDTTHSESNVVVDVIAEDLDANFLEETILTNPQKPAKTLLNPNDFENENTTKKIVREEIKTPKPIDPLPLQLNQIPLVFKFEILATEEFIQKFNTSELGVADLKTEITESHENEKACIDLILKDVEIIKKNKRYVVVQFTVSNIGNVPVAFLGASKKEEDNIAISAHFTRSKKLTRGSIPAKMMYIKKGMKSKDGILQPKESFTQKLKIETYKMSKFSPVLALSIDPFQSVKECTRLNNNSFIYISKNKAPSASDSLPIKPNIDPEGNEITGANSAIEKE